MTSELVKVGIEPGLLAEMDLVVKECNLTAVAALGNFERAFKLAEGMRMLSAMITPKLMGPIMLLQNSKLGFKTDRDPAKDKTVQPYGEEVVKRCLIEALFAGVYPVGNQFNIISAQSYVTQEGFEHKVRSFPGIKSPRLQLGVPVMGNGGALVDGIATWFLDGAPYHLEKIRHEKLDERIVVRVNSGQGADAIFGKAKRKLWKAVYEQLIGGDCGIPDGDVEDVAGLLVSKPTPVAAPQGTVNVGDLTQPKGVRSQGSGVRGQESGVSNEEPTAELSDKNLPPPDSCPLTPDSSQTPAQRTKVELLIKNFGYLRTPVSRSQLEAFIQCDLDRMKDSEILVLQEICGECQRGEREWREGETEPGPLGKTRGAGQKKFA